MNESLNRLLKKIKRLEDDFSDEIQKKQKNFFYEIREKKIYFTKEIKHRHKHLVKKVSTYIIRAPRMHILTVPVIWSLFIPAAIMDVAVFIYQSICFPIYGIPKVRRNDYIVIDRHYLGYLNWIEKLNCLYCSYFNGLIAYIQEIAARTEQYWCPIKHARKTRSMHSRYQKFFDYGDAENYRKELKERRSAFEDVEQD